MNFDHLCLPPESVKHDIELEDELEDVELDHQQILEALWVDIGGEG